MIGLCECWRSGAAWRLRSVLNLRGVGSRPLPHDLRKTEQRASSVRHALLRGRAASVKTRILPLNIRRVLTSLGHDLKSDENAARTGIARWIAGGFMTFDRCIARDRQDFACGPEVRAAGGGVYPAGRWAHPASQPASEGGRER